MISRALARDISDFVSLVESHLARMIEVTHSKLYRFGKNERDQVIKDSLILAFRKRNELDPQITSVTQWFGKCVLEAYRGEAGTPDADELLMLAALAPATPTVATDLATPSSTEGVAVAAAVPREPTDAQQKPGKECPPCWQCRYFDGWLPRGEVKPVVCADPGVYEAIRNLNRRKIEIANYVRGAYDPALLED